MEANQPAERTVLVVDDSRFVRTKLKHIVNGVVAVREEADGEAAWQALQADDTIVMVFSDIDMPKLNGYGLIERIRRSPQPRIRELPVVVFSGSDDEKVEMRARRAGASEFISKYGDEAEMLSRIQEQLRTAQVLRRIEPSAPADPEFAVWRERYDAVRADGRSLAVLCVRIVAYEEIEYRIGRRVGEELLKRLHQALEQFSAAPVVRVAPATFALLTVAATPGEMMAALRGVQDRLAKARMIYSGEVVRLEARCGIATTATVGAGSLDDLVALAKQRCGLNPVLST
ncbi:MAG TPA: response regulator [Burkholderiales bacterium]|nr:response regulator [Burkholderiales bacterium]